MRVGKRRVRRVAAIIGMSVLMALGTVTSALAGTSFQAEVDLKMRRKDSCPNGAFRCGTAVVTGYGTAQYELHVASFVPVSDSCGDYVAFAHFGFADGSQLVLEESGTVCGPGASFYSPGPNSYGNPVDGSGTWQVKEATGLFSGTSGSGISELHEAGAHSTSSYSGNLDD